jgi:hypothetical protein
VGLYDYDARLYSPHLARFISPDSIVPDAGNVQDWNRYAHVRHNPMIYTDPTGHVPILIPLAIIAAKVALKAAPVVVAGAAIAHRAAPAVQRLANAPVAQQAIAKTNQAMASAQLLAARNPQATEAIVEGAATAGMTYARTNDPFEAGMDGVTAAVTGRVDAKVRQMGVENGTHKFVVGAHRTVAQAVGNGVGEITKHLLSTEPGDIVRNWSGQSIAQTFTQFIPGDGLSDTVMRTAVTAYGASQISQAVQRQSCQANRPC